MELDRPEDSSPPAAPPLRWPNGARLALWVIVDLEHRPDDSWRDYGARAGARRLRDLLAGHGVRATAALDAAVCDHQPGILEAGVRAGWEWMGRGDVAERAAVADAIARIRSAAGVAPRGWRSPPGVATASALELLVDAGIEYVGDRADDDRPASLPLPNGKSIVSVPCSRDLDDATAFLDRNATPRDFAEMIVDQFEVLWTEGRDDRRMMGVTLHPFLAGQPFRARHLDRALGRIVKREGVWLATGAEILDAFRASP